MAKRPSPGTGKPATRSRAASSAPIDAIKHKDSRVNIPTRELRDFVADEEKAPKSLLYPRDPSLDPQLVWKGKDEQDSKPLEVPVVPVYIQEKIHPRAIVESLRASAATGGASAAGSAALPAAPEPSLFADFNGLANADFATKVDFYSHDSAGHPHWSNRMILGDSLLVMTSLAEKEGLKGKVQCVYLDPPYGIKFGSNWQVSTRKRDVKDGKAEDATRQPEQVRAFRDTWKLGVHSYLAYLRDRLVIARELLTETGSIFVQIGDENVHLVRSVLDEVFGSENFVSQITFRTTANLVGNYVGRNSDYVLFYAKRIEVLKFRQLFKARTLADDVGARYTRYEMPDGIRSVMSSAERDDISLVPDGARIYRHDNLTSQGATDSGSYSFRFKGSTFAPGSARHWATSIGGLERLAVAGRLAKASENSLVYIRYMADFPVAEFANVWQDTQTGAFTEDKVYVVQTNTKVIERCLLMTTDPGDLVLDPTCGSGTTAYVAEQWGRRWITLDTSRVALALARTRLMSARYSYYHLAEQWPQIRPADSDETIKAILKQEKPAVPDAEADVKRGFVYKRVPHVTLKSIANNPDIKEGMTREEIDKAIAKHAETEILYDKPYEDPKRVRVAGPFTVESLSPHRVLAADEDLDGTVSEQDARKQQDFGAMILNNLKKAGVQNTKKEQRLKFDRLDPHAGVWVHAAGEFTDEAGKSKRVAISIGPEHGTVGPDWVKEAAKEAVQGVGYDVLLVCGFAFDPHVTEEAKRYGKLTVLPTRMNSDLAMGEDLLKKTGAGNLFMVFGEPDVEIRRVKPAAGGAGAKGKGGAEQIEVEVKGVDVYDPTTGQIRSASTDDIACWFIDTDYNGESFFVRQAYFTGADEPYEKLKRALRAEIDEGAWSSLYSTVSRPFDQPATGKIAVKVINHYGDEVLKVFAV